MGENAHLKAPAAAPKPDNAHPLYDPCLDILMNELFLTISSVAGGRLSSSNLKCLLTRVVVATTTRFFFKIEPQRSLEQKLRKQENGLNCTKNHDEDHFPLRHFTVGNEAT